MYKPGSNRDRDEYADFLDFQEFKRMRRTKRRNRPLIYYDVPFPKLHRVKHQNNYL